MRWFDKHTFILCVGSLIFMAANLYFVSIDNYLFGLLPFAFATLLLLFYSLEVVLFVIVFFTPLSIPLRYFFPTLGLDLSLPSEPLLIIATLVFMVKLIVEQRYDKKILSHPVSYALYAYLLWYLFTSITSTMPLVSIKAFVCRTWFITVFYFLACIVFANSKNIKRYVWAYTLAMIVVVSITLIKHSAYFFDHQSAYTIMKPFFDDHTSYGAALALLLPPIVGIWISSKTNINLYFFTAGAILILVLGTIFSYTRAAWVGICASLIVLVIIILKIKLRTIVVIIGVLAAIIIPMKTELYFMLKGNQTDSSTNFSSHIESISNISTDQSNVERLNRWSCAWRMFLDKPIVGYGPGTYMFKYGSYQRSWERSLISTNAADLGNAHSEYLGPLAEQGLLGALLFLAIVILTLITALKIISKTNNAKTRVMAICFMLGLITYYLHGMMNDFLDMDKITALFWGFTAALVALDVYHFEQTPALQVE